MPKNTLVVTVKYDKNNTNKNKFNLKSKFYNYKRIDFKKNIYIGNLALNN